MTGYSRAWAFWALMFGAIEGIAITRSGRTGDDAGTLSAHVAALFHVKHPAGMVAFTVVLVTVSGWFLSHIHGFRNR